MHGFRVELGGMCSTVFLALTDAANNKTHTVTEQDIFAE
jgi:hypothetical protein